MKAKRFKLIKLSISSKVLQLMIASLCMVTIASSQTNYHLSSPDGQYDLNFYQKTSLDSGYTILYTLDYRKVRIIHPSRLELTLDNHLSEQAMAIKIDSTLRWFGDLKVIGIKHETKDTSWVPVHGERSIVRDHYNLLTIEMVKAHNPIYKINLEVRAYNEGIAFRFYFPLNTKGTYYRILNENDEFALPTGTKAWFTGWAQGPYKLTDLKKWPEESERPLTLQLPNGWYACLAEADMTNYARTKFKLSQDKPGTILTSMYTPADLISPFGTPWRVIMVAQQPGQLIEHNYIIQNLNPPVKINNTSWIKPGKIMRVMTQTTQAAKENIDYAAKHHLQYILFDWKWYGPAFEFNSDATKVAIDNFDLPAIINYGKKKGIGVWLYVNQQALLRQSDSLFSIYHKWGVKGVKFGFVQVGSHRWTTWLESMIQKAAANQIMVNIHDDWRPTGEERTWPNLMTAEGIRGNEEMPDATHNTILPFTRFIAGPADYTICYYDKRIKTTHAHQLALGVIYYSPIQTLYWYDSPKMSSDEPELAFWDHLPTTWDNTRVLQGSPEKYIVVARQKKDQWFLGAITNDQARQVDVPLDFLPKGKKFKANIYYDDEQIATKTHVGIKTQIVSSSATLHMTLHASGGQAIWLQPVDK